MSSSKRTRGGSRGRGAEGRTTEAPARPRARALDLERDAAIELPEDREGFVAPPLRSKEHPPADMDMTKPSLDDELHEYHQRPNDPEATEFGYDPEAADAAADLAGELGQSFLMGATRGEDLSDVVATATDAQDEDEMPFVIEEEPLDTVEEPPRPRYR